MLNKKKFFIINRCFPSRMRFSLWSPYPVPTCYLHSMSQSKPLLSPAHVYIFFFHLLLCIPSLVITFFFQLALTSVSHGNMTYIIFFTWWCVRVSSFIHRCSSISRYVLLNTQVAHISGRRRIILLSSVALDVCFASSGSFLPLCYNNFTCSL